MRRMLLALIGLTLGLPLPASGTAAENPHDFQRVGCTHCHIFVPGQSRTVQKGVFRKNIDLICEECHAAALEDSLNHRVGIIPSMRVPEDLHLSAKGELSCITCHDPHSDYRAGRGRTFFLRRGMVRRELCLACHAEENYQEPKVTVRLLAPANNAVVNTLPVPLIGVVSDALLEEVVADINGTELILTVHNGTFSTLLKLNEGINTVRLGGRGVVPAVLNVLYDPALSSDMSYRRYRSHGMLSRKDCFACHGERSRSYAIAADDAALCAKCHDRKNVSRYVHGPVAVGSCTTCHDPHGQTNAYFLVKTGEQLCFQCHREGDVLGHLLRRSDLAGTYLREKGCTYCHDPHQASRRFLLRDKIPVGG